VFGHLDFDGFVGGAVVEHVVDDVALSFGKVGDFAGGLTAGWKGVGCGVWRGGRVEHRRDLRFGIHGS
jgi:hypothetical protein